MLSSNICLGCYFNLRFYCDDDNFCVLLNCKPASHNAETLVLGGLAKHCITVDLQSIFQMFSWKAISFVPDRGA